MYNICIRNTNTFITMFIRKIHIKNLKAFDGSVEINFNPNTNQIDRDLENKYFRKIGENVFFSPVFSIGGGNARGKTSILILLDMLKNFVKPFRINELLFMNYCIENIRDFAPYTNKNNNKNNNDLFNIFHLSLSNGMFIKTICNKINERIDDIDINNYQILDSTIKNVNNEILKNKEYLKWFNNIDLEIKKKLIDNIEIIFKSNIFSSFLENSYRLLLSKWKSIKHFQNKSSRISICIFDEKNDKEYILSIFDEDKNELKYNIKNGDGKKILHKSEKEKIIKYVNSFKFFDFLPNEKKLSLVSSFSTFDHNYQLVNNRYQTLIKNLVINVKNIFKLKTDSIALEKVTEFLSIADPTIKKIILNKNNDIKKGVKFIELQDGSNPNLIDISTGTKKFLDIISEIMQLWNSDDEFVLLIDEIDAFLHIDLVNFFKQLMYNNNSFSQMIFTSHNYHALADYMSNKQIFYISDNNDERSIRKVSSEISKNNSTIDAFYKKIIGSHPYDSLLNKVIWELLEAINEKGK